MSATSAVGGDHYETFDELFGQVSTPFAGEVTFYSGLPTIHCTICHWGLICLWCHIKQEAAVWYHRKGELEVWFVLTGGLTPFSGLVGPIISNAVATRNLAVVSLVASAVNDGQFRWLSQVFLVRASSLNFSNQPQ